MKKRVLSLKWLMFVFVTNSILLLSFIKFLYIDSARDLLKDNLIDIGHTITELYKTQIRDYIQSNDDIAIMSIIKNIKANPLINYVQIVDPNGIILYHNNILAVGQKIKSYENQILQSSNTIVLPTDFGYSYSSLITDRNDQKLCYFVLGLNKEKITKDISMRYDMSKYIIAVALLLILIINFLFFQKMVISSLNNFYKRLNSVLLGDSTSRLQVGKKINEITAIGEVINKILDKFSTKQEVSETPTLANYCDINTISYLLNNFIDKGLLVLDSEYTVVFANKKALTLLGINNLNPQDVRKKHLLDITKSKELIELYKNSMKEPNNTIKTTISDPSLKVEAFSFNNLSGTVVGTAIVFEP